MPVNYIDYSADEEIDDLEYLERKVAQLETTAKRQHRNMAILAALIVAQFLLTLAVICRQNGWL